MLGTSPRGFTDWRAERRHPTRSSVQLMAVLVMIRIGGPHSGRDLAQPPCRQALEVLVDRYLAEEQLQLARRRLRKEQRKLAKAKKLSDILNEAVPPAPNA
jgi:hypothetical protein